MVTVAVGRMAWAVQSLVAGACGERGQSRGGVLRRIRLLQAARKLVDTGIVKTAS